MSMTPSRVVEFGYLVDADKRVRSRSVFAQATTIMSVYSLRTHQGFVLLGS